jgi:hypothetical protein
MLLIFPEKRLNSRSSPTITLCHINENMRQKHCELQQHMKGTLKEQETEPVE